MIKMKRDELTQSLLKEYLTYDPISGIFTANHDSKKHHNLKAGRELGTLDNGYKTIKINGVMFLCHRLAWIYTHGYMPEHPLMLDHIDRNKTNNTISNLRIVSNSENQRNTGMLANNTSGFKGISFNKKNSKWQVTIMIDCVQKYLGSFKTKAEAIKVRRQAEIDYNYHEVKERVA